MLLISMNERDILKGDTLPLVTIIGMRIVGVGLGSDCIHVNSMNVHQICAKFGMGIQPSIKAKAKL